MAIHLRPFITEDQIAARLPTLAADIAEALPAPAREDLVLVGPLKGCVMLLADLSRALWRVGCPHTHDYLRLSSYGGGMESSGQVQLHGDTLHSVAGRHVLLIDDIADTGRTLAFAHAHLLLQGARAVTTAVLLDKPSRRVLPFAVDHVGFTIPDVFVVGYGLDLAEKYRELPHIAVVSRNED